MKDKRLLIPLLTALCLALALAACGQRGPLFLPDETTETVVPEVEEENDQDKDEGA